MSDPPTVLMLDDDRQVTKIMSSFLERRGFSTHATNDSRTAIDQLRLYKPNAVVIDIMMPHVDGYSVARLIRQEPGFEHVPIIAVSSLKDADHYREATRAGINQSLSKPVNADALVAALCAELNAEDQLAD